ncbi:MAG: hypothetical protein ACM3UU_04155 [Ignavibacteriales bacterium]
MKRYIIIAVIFFIAIVTGCFKFKTISFTDKTNIESGINTNTTENTDENQNTEEGFIFNAGKVSFTDYRKTGKTSSNSGNAGNYSNSKFQTVLDFYSYVEDIKIESDKSMEIFEIPGYTKDDISGAIVKNRLILQKSRRLIVPDELFKTSEGYYYAVKFANNYLETLVSARLKLLESMSSDFNKKSEDAQREIGRLKNGVIPNKEAALKFAGQSMMEEEGYVWNDTLNKFELKNSGM